MPFCRGTGSLYDHKETIVSVSLFVQIFAQPNSLPQQWNQLPAGMSVMASTGKRAKPSIQRMPAGAFRPDFKHPNPIDDAYWHWLKR